MGHVLRISEPNLNYCCSAWESCSNTKLNKLQTLQNTAARIITSNSYDSSAAPLLQRLGWLPFHRLVHRETSIMVYKSFNGLAPDSLRQIFSRLSDVHDRVARNTTFDLAIPQERTAYVQNSVSFRGVDTRKKLHCDLKLAFIHSKQKARLIFDIAQGKLL